MKLFTAVVALVFPVLLPLVAAEKPLVVCTTGMIGDMAAAVGGEHVEVVTLMGPGVDPHLFRPTRDDAMKVLNADLVLYNGLLLEGRMEDVFKRAARAGKPVVAVAESLPKEFLMEDEDEPGHPDPHVWMDAAAWARCTEAVEAALTELLPEKIVDFQNNTEAYINRLQELNAEVKALIAGIPKEHRLLVTAHDAFQYFGRAYHIEVMGIQGVSTESEAGLADINRLVAQLVERGIPAIFIESSVPDKNVMAVIEGAKARGHDLRLGGELFSDALGPAGTPEGTYVGMLRHNARTIASALGGGEAAADGDANEPD